MHPNLSELSPYWILLGLTHLGSEASNYQCLLFSLFYDDFNELRIPSLSELTPIMLTHINSEAFIKFYKIIHLYKNKKK